MFATVYKIQTHNKKKYALKIQHIKKIDINPNPKSSVWTEINFFINFANKYPVQFIKLYEYDFIERCNIKQKYSFDIFQFPLSLQKKCSQLSVSLVLRANCIQLN